MILKVAAFLLAVGFTAFIVGTIFGYKGVTVIGAMLVFVVGVLALSGGTGPGGLEYKSGVQKVETDSNTTDVTHQYQRVETPSQLSFGFLFSLLGGALVLQGMNQEVG